MIKQVVWWMWLLSMFILFAYSLQPDRVRLWLIDTPQGRAALAGLVVLCVLHTACKRFRQREWAHGSLSLLTAFLIAYSHFA